LSVPVSPPPIPLGALRVYDRELDKFLSMSVSKPCVEYLSLSWLPFTVAQGICALTGNSVG
jgi:hypothetical protein